MNNQFIKKDVYNGCGCFCLEHLHRYTFFSDPDETTLYLSVLLNKRPWYARLWHSMLYLFGKNPKWGYFESHMQDIENVGNIKGILFKFINESNIRK